MLFPTLASGVLLALLGAPSVLAIQDLLPVDPLLELPLPLGLRPDSPVHPRDDGISPSDPLPPTRVRRAPAAFEHINPTDVVTRPLAHAHNAPRARALTNAQRLANGLPPLSPRRTRRYRTPAPRTSPKPCTNPTGTLMMTDIDSDVVLGPVGSMANSFGEYGLGSGPLEVVLRQCSAEGLPFEVETSVRASHVSCMRGWADASVRGVERPRGLHVLRRDRRLREHGRQHQRRHLQLRLRRRHHRRCALPFSPFAHP